MHSQYVGMPCMRTCVGDQGNLLVLQSPNYRQFPTACRLQVILSGVTCLKEHFICALLLRCVKFIHITKSVSTVHAHIVIIPHHRDLLDLISNFQGSYVGAKALLKLLDSPSLAATQAPLAACSWAKSFGNPQRSHCAVQM